MYYLKKERIIVVDRYVCAVSKTIENEIRIETIPGDVIHKQRTGSPSVVGPCNGSERLLARLIYYYYCIFANKIVNRKALTNS